jgi:hypothetical protein
MEGGLINIDFEEISHNISQVRFALADGLQMILLTSKGEKNDKN